MVGSPPTTGAVRATEPPRQIETPPPAILTVGFAPVIPVKADVRPAVKVAPVEVRVFAPNATNFVQGLVV